MSDNSKSRWANLASPKRLAALSAVIIGACALVVAFYEVRIMRSDQRASELPLLELYGTRIWSDWDDSGPSGTAMRLKFSAENVGTGPAKVVDFRVTVDGSTFKTWGDAMRALLGRDEPISYGNSTIMGRTIRAGRSIDMFSLTNTELAGEINAIMDRLDFEACFCSVFNECWTTTHQDIYTTSEVAGCQPDANSFQE